MPINEEKRKAIIRCVVRLALKNTGTFHMLSSAIQGWISGSMDKHVVARVFGFDPRDPLPVEDLVAESLLNGLEGEDIEEIFRRYADRQGLKF